MRRWFLRRKMYHAWLFDFLDGLGGGNDPLNFQNRAIGGFWENARFIRSNGRKTTFEWPTVVSEVIFPRFWGVVCIEKCFRNFEILTGSAVSEMSRFASFCAKRGKRDISEKALPIKISKFRKHFSIQTTPQNLGKITSETTFDHSKVVFRPFYV